MAKQRVPKVGDEVWWRGMRQHVISVSPDGSKFTRKNDQFRCTSMVRDAVFNDGIGAFVLPGTEGPMPKTVRGKLVDPPIPVCERCGQTSWRRNICTNCRLELARSK